MRRQAFPEKQEGRKIGKLERRKGVPTPEEWNDC
jgi:hypothetical protein